MKFDFYGRPIAGMAIATDPDNNPENNGGSGGIPPEPVTEPPPVGEDLSGLKKALESERSAAKELKRKVAQMEELFKGIDPEKYKQLEALQKQAEEWNQREITIKQELEKDYQNAIANEQKKVQTLESQYKDLVLRTQAEKAYSIVGGRTGGGEDGITFFEAFFGNITKSLRLNDQGQIEVIDANGVRRFSKKDASKPMPASEFFAELVTHPVLGHYFQPQKPGKGGGMQPQQPGVVATGADLSNMSRSDRLTVLRQTRPAGIR